MLFSLLGLVVDETPAPCKPGLSPWKLLLPLSRVRGTTNTIPLLAQLFTPSKLFALLYLCLMHDARSQLVAFLVVWAFTEIGTTSTSVGVFWSDDTAIIIIWTTTNPFSSISRSSYSSLENGYSFVALGDDWPSISDEPVAVQQERRRITNPLRRALRRRALRKSIRRAQQ